MYVYVQIFIFQNNNNTKDMDVRKTSLSQIIKSELLNDADIF